MKIAVLIGAALLGTAGIAATPADAQRDGWNDRYDRGWNGDRGWRDDRRWNNGGGWRGDRNGYGNRRWNGNRGWNGGRRWNRSRLVCRTYDGYYGPERRCFRVNR